MMIHKKRKSNKKNRCNQWFYHRVHWRKLKDTIKNNGPQTPPHVCMTKLWHQCPHNPAYSNWQDYGKLKKKSKLLNKRSTYDPECEIRILKNKCSHDFSSNFCSKTTSFKNKYDMLQTGALSSCPQGEKDSDQSYLDLLAPAPPRRGGEWKRSRRERPVDISTFTRTPHSRLQTREANCCELRLCWWC